jgi:hypothetical protein
MLKVIWFESAGTRRSLAQVTRKEREKSGASPQIAHPNTAPKPRNFSGGNKPFTKALWSLASIDSSLLQESPGRDALFIEKIELK